jgi:rSAM/selenodomain-associated transferase 1
MAEPARDVLGLLAKWPEAGRVKTRLASATSSLWAARVAEALLADALDRLSNLPLRRILAYTPLEREPEFSRLVRGRFELVQQCGGDLGQRMAEFFAARFAEGARRVVLVGTDSPTMPLEFIQEAFESLVAADIVLGPAADGGYYLVGGTPKMPRIFDSGQWGQSTVLADTVARIPPKVSLALLPPWYDVDSAEDWNMVRGHLAALRHCRIDVRAPRTERLALIPSPPLNWTINVSAIPLPFREALAWVVENGFSHVELPLAEEPGPEQVESLADAGVFVTSVVVATQAPLDGVDGSRRRKAVQQVTARLTAATRLGATVCVLDAVSRPDPGSRARFADSCGHLLSHAESQFLRLCVPALEGDAPPGLGRCWNLAREAADSLDLPVDHVRLLLAETPAEEAVAAVRRLRATGYTGPVVLGTAGEWRLLPQMLARLEKAAFIDLSPE